MKYLCLVVIDEKQLEALSNSEADALTDQNLAYDEMLRQSGICFLLRRSNPLRPPRPYGCATAGSP